MSKPLVLASLLLAAADGVAAADTTPQPLPFSQDWSNAGLITTADNWDGVPGIVGYWGTDASTATGPIDPRTVVDERFDTPRVTANVGAATSTFGGISEFALPDPVVGLQGSGTADAPFLVLTVNTTGVSSVRVRYDLRELDADDAPQAVTLQYRVGTTGNFTNVPAGYVADAATAATEQVTAVDATLPADAGNQPVVQVRVLTANALGSDSWIGVDNIRVDEASQPPTAIGATTPASAPRGTSVLVTADVTPGTVPASTNLLVLCDLSPLGGDSAQQLFDDGTSGDVTAADGRHSVTLVTGAGIAAGPATLDCVVGDDEGRLTDFTATHTVLAVCGDGVTEGAEACDDGDAAGDDGCSATCSVETGWSCTAASPSVCADVDECALMTDTCDDVGGTCTNRPAVASTSTRGFTCGCATGFAATGDACDPVCGDGQVVAGEACDDGDTMSGDGCSATCAVENGWSCTGDPSACSATCGDGLVSGPETCDDGDTIAGDGCSATCAVEDGYACEGTPSACASVCGDGQVVAGEACDDGDTTAGDGCSATCAVEDGWTCKGEPSTCSELSACGDGVVDAGELCDDGNQTIEDGCDLSCAIEAGFTCDGEPSVCVEDGDGDGIEDGDDNCPTVANPSQADSDEDGFGNACDETPDGPTTEGGCCSTSSDNRGVGGLALLAFATLLGLRRRRR